jgi:hypothetical protein
MVDKEYIRAGSESSKINEEAGPSWIKILLLNWLNGELVKRAGFTAFQKMYICVRFYQLHHMPQKWESPLRAMHEWFISDNMGQVFF